MKGGQDSRIAETTRRRLQDKLSDPRIPDHENPEFLFSLTSNDLLLAILAGVTDPHESARNELANRGIDATGRNVGFERARRAWGIE